MRRTAVCTAPAFILSRQPGPQTFLPHHFHILPDALVVGPIRVDHKVVHLLAGAQLGTLVTKVVAFAAGAGFDAAGYTMSGGLLAFAAITGIGRRACFGCQHAR